MIEQNDSHQQLRSFIDNGGYSPGDRLPAERELIGSLGISRNSLRKGLDALEREGAIWRHVGKGTFIAADPKSVPPTIAAISEQVTPLQMMRARLSLEPVIASEAAANASGAAISMLKNSRDAAASASSWDLYEKNDDDFHRAIADATGNPLLLSLFDHLNQVRRAVAWAQVVRKNDRPPSDHSSFVEHDLILNAVEARDPIGAHRAMRSHLKSVSLRLFGED